MTSTEMARQWWTENKQNYGPGQKRQAFRDCAAKLGCKECTARAAIQRMEYGRHDKVKPKTTLLPRTINMTSLLSKFDTGLKLRELLDSMKEGDLVEDEVLQSTLGVSHTKWRSIRQRVDFHSNMLRLPDGLVVWGTEISIASARVKLKDMGA